MVDVEIPRNSLWTQLQSMSSWSLLPSHNLLACVIVGCAVADVRDFSGHRRFT